VNKFVSLDKKENFLLYLLKKLSCQWGFWSPSCSPKGPKIPKFAGKNKWEIFIKTCLKCFKLKIIGLKVV